MMDNQIIFAANEAEIKIVTALYVHDHQSNSSYFYCHAVCLTERETAFYMAWMFNFKIALLKKIHEHEILSDSLEQITLGQ